MPATARRITRLLHDPGYLPIPSALPVWPEGWQATWPASTSILVSGERDGVLIDALVTKDESRELADWLTGTGKNLTDVYITHGHGDHFFGLNTILETFPHARAVSLPEIVPALADQATPDWLQIWESFFPGQLFEKPAVPVPLESPELKVEGHTLRVLELGQSDVPDSSVIHIPELETLVAGDVVYNGIHCWTYQSTPADRMAWIETVNEVEKLGVKTIIAGHSDPNAPDNDAARMIDATRQYLLDFNEAVASSSAGEEVVSKMTAKYPQLGNPYTLWLGAYTQTYAN